MMNIFFMLCFSFLQGFSKPWRYILCLIQNPTDCKKAKSFSLAPIEVEILVNWGSVYKIVTKSGTVFPKMPDVSASNY